MERIYFIHQVREDKYGWFRNSQDLGEDLKVGDKCLVEGREREELGVVKGKINSEGNWINRLPKVVEKLDEEGLRELEEIEELERRAYDICKRKIRELLLPMELVRVKATLDRDKIIFYFTAPGRVDFRKLVRELARIFRVRIELRQIGVRDKARLLRGIGPCGLPLCCYSFLTSFEAVSVRKAKEQDLSLDPFKIGGCCGRLRCCISYEWPIYKEIKKTFPKVGSKVKWEGKSGEVIKISPLKNSVLVKKKDGSVEEVKLSLIERGV